MVTAKEILSDQKLRTEYDSERNALCKLQEQRRKERQRRHQMDSVRREQIERLEAMEKRAELERRAEMHSKYRFETKRDSVKAEVDRFRALIREQQRKAMEEEKDRERATKNEERKKRRTLTVRVDRKRCHRPYSGEEMEAIFKIYGKIKEVLAVREGAEITFKKSASVWRAVEDEENLKEQFGVLVVLGNGQKLSHKMKGKSEGQRKREQAKRWREFVDRRRSIRYETKREMVWKEVQQFLAQRRGATE